MPDPVGRSAGAGGSAPSRKAGAFAVAATDTDCRCVRMQRSGGTVLRRSGGAGRARRDQKVICADTMKVTTLKSLGPAKATNASLAERVS